MKYIIQPINARKLPNSCTNFLVGANIVSEQLVSIKVPCTAAYIFNRAYQNFYYTSNRIINGNWFFLKICLINLSLNTD